MSPAAWVVVCALELLGRKVEQLPPIVVVDARPAEVSANADAFANLFEGVIYLVASAPAFRTAEVVQSISGECHPRNVLKMVASIIVHEEWHLKHGRDEKGAYEAQLAALRRLGLVPGVREYDAVTRGMRSVVKAQSR